MNTGCTSRKFWDSSIRPATAETQTVIPTSHGRHSSDAILSHSWRNHDFTHRVNEFYEKGCQEKKLRLDRRRDFFLEIQPTVVSFLWRSLACYPLS